LSDAPLGHKRGAAQQGLGADEGVRAAHPSRHKPRSIDMNTAQLGIHLGHVILEGGPSLEVFAVPLCADTRCQREYGLAPAGHLGAVLLPAPARERALAQG
jgi:hypothetical protein